VGFGKKISGSILPREPNFFALQNYQGAGGKLGSGGGAIQHECIENNFIIFSFFKLNF